MMPVKSHAGGGSLWSMSMVCSAGRCTRGRCGEEECSNFKRLRMMETILDFQVNRKELGKKPNIKEVNFFILNVLRIKFI